MMTKKEMADAKAAFELHVALIRRQDAVTVTTARITAWAEGDMGLNARLGTPKLPLTAEEKK